MIYGTCQNVFGVSRCFFLLFQWRPNPLVRKGGRANSLARRGDGGAGVAFSLWGGYEDEINKLGTHVDVDRYDR